VTSEDLASIELLCEQMNEADRSSIEWADRDRQFKFAIYSKSGSSSLRDFITRAWLQIGPAMRGVDRSKADLDPGCREFVAALRAHVSAAARRLLELDIRASADAALLQPVHA
jgi:DNA-binding GntR family transcriptional regulator